MSTQAGQAGQAYLFESEDIIADVATMDDVFAKSGNRILAVGFHVWLMRLVSSGRVRFDMREMAKEVKEGRGALTECMSTMTALGLVIRVKYQGGRGQWVTDTVVFKTPATHEQIARLAHAPSYRGAGASIEYCGASLSCADLRDTYPIAPAYRRPGVTSAPATRFLVAGFGSETASSAQEIEHPAPATRNLVAVVSRENIPFSQLIPDTRSPAAAKLVAHKELRTDDLSIESSEPASHSEEPTTPGQDLVLDLAYGAHGLPSRGDARMLGALADTALTQYGVDAASLRKHLQTALNEVRPPNQGGRPVPYLAGALEPDRLPARPRRTRPRAVINEAPQVDSGSDQAEKPMTREEALAFGRANTKPSQPGVLKRRGRPVRKTPERSPEAL